MKKLKATQFFGTVGFESAPRRLEPRQVGTSVGDPRRWLDDAARGRDGGLGRRSTQGAGGILEPAVDQPRAGNAGAAEASGATHRLLRPLLRWLRPR